MNSKDIKYVVKEKYGQIVSQDSGSCGCGPSCCSTSSEYSMFNDNYSDLKGYNPDADFGLGCGLPTEFAQISEGDTVVDLGSGAGNDCFVARAMVGDSGRVIGIDMTEQMIAKARKNLEKLQYSNIEFIQGDIEDMPLDNDIADVVISNCVLNLVPDKQKAFSEIHRILKQKGHLSVSDVVLKGDLPDKLRDASEMYVGCVSGAIPQDQYLALMQNVGLTNIKIQKSKQIILPDELLSEYLSPSELAAYKASGDGVYSITVYAEK